MVTAGQNPVNLRDQVIRLSGCKWPAIFDVSVQPRFTIQMLTVPSVKITCKAYKSRRAVKKWGWFFLIPV